MHQVVVRYRVKPDRVTENVDLVGAVYEELGRTRPEGLEYATFQLDDGVSFVHVARTEDGRDPLKEVRAFRRFLEGIDDRCDEPPLAAAARPIGSFGVYEERGT